MKKCIKIFGLCVMLLSMIMTSTVFAGGEIKVMLNGEYIDFDVQPQLIDNRTMVPLRAIFEALGADVDWDGSTQTVTAVKDDTEVVATIGSKKMYVNDVLKKMDVAPLIVGGRTLVPARFVAEAFECDVDWDGENQEVLITTQTDFQNRGNDSILGMYILSRDDEIYNITIYDYQNEEISILINGVKVYDEEDVIMTSISGNIPIESNTYNFNFKDSFGNSGKCELTILDDSNITLSYYDIKLSDDFEWGVSDGDGTYTKVSDSLEEFEINIDDSGEIY